MGHETRITLLALAGGLPALLAVGLLLWSGGYQVRHSALILTVVAAAWAAGALILRRHVAYPLRTLSNMLSALREGDYSLRVRAANRSDAMGELVQEANQVAQMLREQRLGAMEAANLLRKVMEEIDVAIFAFDGDQKLRLVNRAGARLLAEPAERLTGRPAAELELDRYLTGDIARTVQTRFPQGSGRWSIRRSNFREHGEAHDLLVVSDLSRELREQELLAWQRLVRVLGHEINNSLAPIQSISGSLAGLLEKEDLPEDWRDDVTRGLKVIESRSAALSRFTGTYARLARLPAPSLQPVRVRQWIERVARLETRLTVRIVPGPEVTIGADEAQLDQLLINLVRNAADAVLDNSGDVTIRWTASPRMLTLEVLDEGPGLRSDANLFVPFFTTKPAGSGIGLVLSRQIAEAHGGSLQLSNREDGQTGCIARLELPF